MSQMWGADADALDQTAARLQSAADQLERIAHRLTGQLQATRWPTPQGERFRSDWNRRHLRGLTSSAQHLREGAGALRENARRQREASGVGVSSGLAVLRRHNLLERLGGLAHWAKGDGRKLLLDLRHATMDEIKRAWLGLSPGERKGLTILFPGLVALLPGVPSDDRAAAMGNVNRELAGDVVTFEEEWTAEAGGKVPLEVINVVFGEGGGAKVTGHADGTVDVTLNMNGKVGVGVGISKIADVEGTVGGKVSQTYTFHSRAEAEQFLAGLVHAAAPLDRSDIGVVALALMTSGSASMSTMLLNDAAHDGAEYLARFQGQLTHQEIEVNESGKLSVGNSHGPAGVEIGATRSASFDTVTRETTLAGEVTASGHIGPLGGEGSLKGSVTYDEHGQATSIELDAHVSGTVDALSKSDLFAKSGVPAGFKVAGGVSADVKIKLDLTDPAVRSQSAAFVDAFAKGDPAALQHLSNVVDRGSVVVQTMAVDKATLDLDAQVVNAKVEAITSVPTNTWVREPGGAWSNVQAPRAASALLEGAQ